MNGQRPRRWRGDRQDRRPPLGRTRAPDGNPEVEQRIRELDSDREPMSLAEEIAYEARQIGREARSTTAPSSGNGEVSAPRVGPPGNSAAASTSSSTAEQGSTFAELQAMSEDELQTVAAEAKVAIEGLGKRELVFQILKARLKNNGLMFGEGTLEILPDGFGFLQFQTPLHLLSR